MNNFNLDCALLYLNESKDINLTDILIESINNEINNFDNMISNNFGYIEEAIDMSKAKSQIVHIWNKCIEFIKNIVSLVKSSIKSIYKKVSKSVISSKIRIAKQNKNNITKNQINKIATKFINFKNSLSINEAVVEDNIEISDVAEDDLFFIDTNIEMYSTSFSLKLGKALKEINDYYELDLNKGYYDRRSDSERENNWYGRPYTISSQTFDIDPSTWNGKWDVPQNYCPGVIEFKFRKCDYDDIIDADKYKKNIDLIDKYIDTFTKSMEEVEKMIPDIERVKKNLENQFIETKQNGMNASTVGDFAKCASKWCSLATKYLSNTSKLINDMVKIRNLYIHNINILASQK